MSKRIIDLNTISSASNDDYLVVDGSSGTRKITPENIVGNSAVAQSLLNQISDASDAIDEMQITIGTLQSEIENIPEVIEQDVTDWLNDHPEATTTVQDGAITEAKLGKDIYLDKYRNVCAVPNTNVLLSSIEIDYTQSYTLQGGCYNSNNNHIVLAFHKANDPDCIIKELDSDWNLIKTATLTLYHANDITYNPNTDKYYVADGENSNTVYEVDSALSAVNTITVSVGGVIGQISYDVANDRYYLLVGEEIYICDAEFDNAVFYATLNTDNDYSGVQSVYIGGSCMLGDSFVSMVWFYRNGQQSESYTRLCFANADKDYDEYYFDFRSQSSYDEQEALLEYPDKIVCIGYVADSITRTNIYKKGIRQEGLTCHIGDIYSNVNRIPVNSYGVCTIKASSSPTGADITGVYICYGRYDMRTLRLTTQDADYYRFSYGSNQWTPWHNNKEILNSLIVSETLTIASGETISANASSAEYVVEIPAKVGYTPFCVTHRTVSAPVIFLWYMYLVADSTKDSGYVVKARYRNTGSSQQTNQNITATVYYVRTT